MTSFSFPLQSIIFMVLIEFSDLDRGASREHVVVQPCRSWDTALSVCRLSGPAYGLPVIRNPNDYKIAANLIRSHNLSVTWLGLRRQRLRQFTWLDCSPAPDDFAAQEWPASLNCGYVNIFDETLDADKCSKPKGVICELKNCTQCSLVECTRILGRCFYKTCTSKTWESGRAYCKSRGWDLAVLGSTEERKFRERMVSLWEGSSCRFYWVGLRREEWVYPHTFSDNVTRVYWGRREPGLSGDCAVMIRTEAGYSWRAVSCAEGHQALCYRQNRTDNLTGTALQTCRSWQTASSTCSSVQEDLQLPVIRNTEEFLHIAQEMRHYSVNVTWLALTKRNLGKFLWLDCKIAPPEFTAQRWNTTTNCAFLNTRDNMLEADACSSLKGVVCEIESCRDCSVKECTRIQGKCFFTTCTPMTWEAARAYCRSRGWDLAVLGSTDEGTLLKQAMSNRWINSSCKIYWIGLRREEWVYPNNAHGKSTHVYWDRNEPSDAGKCSIMVKTPGGYKWRAADCSDRHPGICVRSKVRVLHLSRPPLSSTSAQSRTWFGKSTRHLPTESSVTKIENVANVGTYHGLLIGIILVSFMFIMTLITAFLYLYYQRICIKKAMKKGHELVELVQRSDAGPRIRESQNEDEYYYPKRMKREHTQPSENHPGTEDSTHKKL